MRAVVHERYGPPEVLRIADVAKPTPKEGEVLVRVHATTVTRGDTELRTLEYGFLRPFMGIRRPRRRVAGTEFAGRVEEVGAAVEEFHAGDDVFGVKAGANAEYVTVRASGAIARMPERLSYEEAAAVPEGSLLALTMLRPLEPLRGKSVVVYGAAGSIGSGAVQLLVHHFGAEVTAVCDAKDVELVRSLGAHAVLDRFEDDFTTNRDTYDVVFDAVGKHAFRRARRALKPGGVYVTSGSGDQFFAAVFASLATRVVGNKRAKLGIGRYRKQDLVFVRELVDAGTYRPVVDRIYTLDEAVEANRYVETGGKSGNVVLRVTQRSGS
ncbi:MAG TPA: NAD(P)-dependent alcohol dehydrogenase [Gaiellaceae bacterium]|nr:NAD(P)-dependent alcohol dehydrogenase [Gaiellaceae bacterium]